ncbi:hypothetical protein YPS_2016 [Yersinia pestis Pestoides A]|nr:hypothetical protein YPS_2016 [Yersinia pestis Pestoides A]
MLVAYFYLTLFGLTLHLSWSYSGGICLQKATRSDG